MSTTALSGLVSRGSDALQLLSGRTRTAATMLSTITGLKYWKDATTDVDWNSGGGAPAVEDRTLATLSSNKRWNCSALTASTGGTRPRPSSASTEFLCRSSLARNVVASVAGVHDTQSVASASQRWILASRRTELNVLTSARRAFTRDIPGQTRGQMVVTE